MAQAHSVEMVVICTLIAPSAASQVHRQFQPWTDLLLLFSTHCVPTPAPRGHFRSFLLRFGLMCRLLKPHSTPSIFLTRKML